MNITTTIGLAACGLIAIVGGAMMVLGAKTDETIPAHVRIMGAVMGACAAVSGTATIAHAMSGAA